MTEKIVSTYNPQEEGEDPGPVEVWASGEEERLTLFISTRENGQICLGSSSKAYDHLASALGHRIISEQV